jgi:hypothetical protein
MPQWRHEKERFSPKGDEFEPQCVAKNRAQIDQFPPEECIQKKRLSHRATNKFQVRRLV